MNHPRRTLRTIAELAAAGLAGPDPGLAEVARRYAVALTPAVVGLIRGPAASDPVARQFVPTAAELVAHPEELADPIGDGAHSPVTGIVHRYPDRVLLKPILHCPVYCRFCFRRETVGREQAVISQAELDGALDYIRRRPEVWEVILTGGDPLMLPPARLEHILRALDAIAHVAVIRLHTRVPIADPDRVSPALLAALAGPGKAVWLAVHVNHANELGPGQRAALRALSAAGLPLVSQTVLLAGINDDAATLEALFRALVANRVKPYYLHHPDLAPGTAHFRPPLATGRALVRALRGRLSGLAQPTYVLDIPGGAGKVPIGPDHWHADTGEIEDASGRRHPYPG